MEKKAMYNTDSETLRKEVKIETFKSSKPGGQHMQKREMGVRITHLLSGIVIESQRYRYQSMNLNDALEKLQKRLIELQKPKKPRILTKPSLGAKLERLKEKGALSEKKQLRRKPTLD